jgi:hypothetical protein
MAQDKGILFICYRRDETAGHAGWLADKLSERFGEDKVFRDIDSIEPGLDFVEAVQRAIGSSEVLIAVICRSWLTAADATGRQRLHDPEDYVRMEIATALKRNTRVMPVLVQGASMPRTDELPNDLAALTRRNAIELHDTNWETDVRHFITTLERAVSSSETGEATTRENIERRTRSGAAYGSIRVKRRDQIGFLVGQEVYLDGKKVGELRTGQDILFDAPTGEHRVRVRIKPGFMWKPDEADKK